MPPPFPLMDVVPTMFSELTGEVRVPLEGQTKGTDRPCTWLQSPPPPGLPLPLPLPTTTLCNLLLTYTLQATCLSCMCCDHM